MRHKPFALVLIGLLVLSSLLVGCRRSAAPPVGELTPEEEATAAMQEAQENTGQAGESPVATPVPTTEETAEATEEPTEVAPTTESPATEPTVAPTATTAPVEQPTAEATTAAPTVAPTPVASTECGTYVVQPGDNLFRIALRYNMTVTALAQANNITNPSLVYVGQKIAVPCEGSGTTQPPQQPTGQCETVYVVQPGDNLFRIALRYNYSQYYLAQVNGITNPAVVYVGQQICIP